MSTTALFIGDSITDMNRRSDPSGHLGAGYVRRIKEMTAERDLDVAVVNRGIGGDRVKDLRRRWLEDSIAVHPDIVTILIGTNDTWRRYDAGDATSVESYRADLVELLDRSTAAGVTSFVVMEPFLVPINQEQESWANEDLNDKRQAAREVATLRSARFVPLQQIFDDAVVDNDPYSVIEDGVHPNATGHQLIATAWLETAQDLLHN